MEVIRQSCERYRVADPSWNNPLDGTWSMRFGGRWNRPGSFPVTYLSADLATARANARRLLLENLRGQPFAAADLDPSELPLLVSVDLPDDRYLDVITDRGCLGNGLPVTYPRDSSGKQVSWAVCQPVGQEAWGAGLAGVACRSAAPSTAADGQELAWFDRHEVKLQPTQSRTFQDWYGVIDW